MIKNIIKSWIVFISFLSFSIFITINSIWLYICSIGPLKLVQVTGVSSNHLISEYTNIVNYLENPFYHNLNFKYFTSSYSGILHFQDVKKLVMVNNSILLITVPISFLIIIRMLNNQNLWEFILPIRTVAVFLIFLSVMMFINFDGVFIGFHKLFFRNDYWIFDPKLDPIINALPDSYFALCFGFCLLIFIVLTTILYFYALKQIKKHY